MQLDETDDIQKILLKQLINIMDLSEPLQRLITFERDSECHLLILSSHTPSENNIFIFFLY